MYLSSLQNLVHPLTTLLPLGMWIGLLSISQPALAQSRFERQVQRQLEDVADLLDLDGQTMTHEPYIDRLYEDEVDNLTLTLQGGRTYAIIGVCDNDCHDLDFDLYDNDDNLLESDHADDDYPFVQITPAWTDTFTLNVIMYNCKTEPCYYGVGVFSDDGKY